MNHIDLAGLLSGELSNDETLSSGEHLRDCADCRAELSDQVVGHSLLAKSSRLLAHTSVEPLVAPPLQMPAASAEDVRGKTSRWKLSLVAAAIAAVGATSFFGGRATVEPSVAPLAEDQPKVSARAALEAVDGTGTGEVQMLVSKRRATLMEVTTTLPKPPRGSFYYVWLFDPETNKMLPLGQVGPGGKASFEVDDALLGSYSAIDVSLERDDGDPEHSVKSVLRAQYGAASKESNKV